MEKRWSKTEIAHLKRHGTSKSLVDLAKRLHVDEEAVRLKLVELGLTRGGSIGPENDAAFGDFTKALESFYDHKWSAAAKAFEKVLGKAEDPQLLDRTRQFIAICQRHSEDAVKADPYLQAVFEKNNGNLEEALKICADQGTSEKDERYAYLVASLKAMAGELDDALDHLTTAIRLEPKNRVHAYHDPDFEELRSREEFTELVAVS